MNEAIICGRDDQQDKKSEYLNIKKFLIVKFYEVPI